MNCENCGNESASLEEAPSGNFKRNRRGVIDTTIGICDRCASQYECRQEAVARVIDSGSPKKLIVAGPGTGKTHTFRRLVESLPDRSRVIIFTLINNLVDDLKELEQIQGRDVNAFTFHGFCKSLLYQDVGGGDEFSYTGVLPDLISEDADLLELEFEVDSEQAFSELRENEDSVAFYLCRADYYQAVGYVDSVYRVFNFFRESPGMIREYALVIADEYQDFNRLEAAFIDLLATRSYVLLAGDDDQALYSFRFASHEFIRAVFGNADFEKFNLPLCSRCPPVLIQATTTFIENAIAAGNLAGRIPKDFECYWPEKFVEHALHPKINHYHCSTKATAQAVVENEIRRIYDAEKDEIDKSNDIPFLIIGPNSRHQLKSLYQHLTNTLGGDFDLDMSERSKSTIEEAYQMLKKHPRGNLGWRIVMFHSPLEHEEMQRIIRETYENDVDLVDLLPPEYMAFHVGQLEKPTDEVHTDLQELNRPKVKFTTFLGAKGLSARHVFVIGLNNGEFPEDPKKATDAEVCEFIVALTRAKFSCSLISNKWYSAELQRLVDSPSKFLRMIGSDAKQTIKVNMKKGRPVRA